MAHVETAKFSGWLDSLIQAGTVIGMQVLGGGGGGASGGGGGQPARGLAAIRAATSQIIQALEALRSQIGQGNYQEIIAQAQALTSALSNPSIIYQAQRGEDAAVLEAAKTRANQILQEMATLGASVSAVQTGANQAGQVIAAGGTLTQQLLADKTLIYMGFGFVALYFLIKK